MDYFICFSQAHDVDTITLIRHHLSDEHTQRGRSPFPRPQSCWLEESLGFKLHSLTWEHSLWATTYVSSNLYQAQSQFSCFQGPWGTSWVPLTLLLFTFEVLFIVSPAHRLALHVTLTELLSSTYLKYTSGYILLLNSLREKWIEGNQIWKKKQPPLASTFSGKTGKTVFFMSN